VTEALPQTRMRKLTAVQAFYLHVGFNFAAGRKDGKRGKGRGREGRKGRKEK